MTQIEKIWALQEVGISLPSAVCLVQFATSPYYNRGDEGRDSISEYLRIMSKHPPYVPVTSSELPAWIDD